MHSHLKNKQYYKFCLYGFLKNLRFFDAFFILFLIDKGLSFTHIGSLYAIREIIIHVFELPSGLLADTYGRKHTLMFSFVAYIISFVMFYQATNYWWFVLAFSLFGIGDAFRSGTHKGMIMDYLKHQQWSEHKIGYYGHTRSWSQKGSALSSLIAGIIVFYTGMIHSIFIYSIIPYVINLALIYSYPEALNKSPNQVKNNHNIKQIFLSFFTVMKQPKVLRIVNSAAAHTAYLKALKDYIQPIMVHVAVIFPILVTVEVDKKNGLIIGVLYFFIYLATSQASRMASKFDKTKLNAIFMTLMIGFVLGLMTGIFYWLEWWVLALLCFIGIHLIENLRKPVLTGIISDNVPHELLTSVLSAQNLLRTVMTAGIALIFGILADHFGIPIAFIVISLASMLLSYVVNYMTQKHGL